MYNDSLIDQAETRINGWLAEYYIKHDSSYKPQLDSMNVAMEQKDWETFIRLNKNFRELAKSYSAFEQYTIPETHRKYYKTIGGTPHLDQNYTVFGEVVYGLEIIDSIAIEKTDNFDRPLNNIRILSATVVEN